MSLATITAQAGLILRDTGESFQARVMGDGDTTTFTLPRDNVAVTGAYIEADPVPITLTPAEDSPIAGEYVVDAKQGIITLGEPLAQGETLVVDGKSYVATLPDDMSGFIDMALELHLAGRYPRPAIDDLSTTESYLVSMLAVIENLWSQATEASNEIDVMTPEGVNIPASQRFAQILTLIERLQEHYKELASALNVGPYRIMVSTLRRVSRTTNRLVPLYMPQEFDDRTYPPTRIYPPIDSGLMEVEE